MKTEHGSGGANPTRRDLAWVALGLSLSAPAVALAQEPPLQLSYSTDPYMTCDALQEEIARMDAIIAAKGTSAAVAKTATERKQRIKGILGTKNCAPAPAKVFGPDMYDLPGTAPPKR
jgi:hypothetical protein